MVTGIYIAFGILAVAIIVLLMLFLNLAKKVGASAKTAEQNSKMFTNNKIEEIKKITPRITIDKDNKAILTTPEGANEIYSWQIEKDTTKSKN